MGNFFLLVEYSPLKQRSDYQGLLPVEIKTKGSGGSGRAMRTQIGLCLGSRYNATLQGRIGEDLGETG